MKKTQVFFFAIAAMVFITISVSSCKKKTENLTPVVTITTPANHDEFTVGNMIHVVVTATDEKELHEMKLEVKQDGTDSVIFAYYPMVHELPSFTIDTMFTAPVVVAETEYHIEAEAEDHESGITSTEIHIHVNP